MKYLKILLLLFIFFSCKNGVNIELINKSKLNLEKIIIKTTFSENNLGSLKVNETKKIFLNFNKNNSKQDGIIRLLIHKRNIKNQYDFGYYSNGVPPENRKIIIENDTVLFKIIY